METTALPDEDKRSRVRAMDAGTLLATVVGAGIGAVIGIGGSFGLQSWVWRRQDRQAREKQRELIDNVRLLLHLEMQRNLDAVKRLNHRVIQIVEGLPEEMEFERLVRFAGDPLPLWERTAWIRLTAQLPTALVPEQIRAAATMLDTFAMLGEYHDVMARQLPDRLVYNLESWLKSSPASRTPMREYKPLADALDSYGNLMESVWQRCKGIMNELAQAENPIPQPRDTVSGNGGKQEA